MDRKWTVMVYLAGDTEDMLSAEMIFALKEMKEVRGIGPDHPVTVLALFDPCAEGSNLERYVIHGSGSTKEDIGERASIKESLLEFIKWGVNTYKADQYMLVLSGHASGPEGNCLLPDQDPPNALSLRDLHDVIHGTYTLLNDRPIDILGLSCCLGNMVELCHELQAYPEEAANGSYVDYLIGAEGYEPLTGWPYKEIFSSVVSKADAGVPAVAKSIVQQYAGYYKEYVKANVSTYIAAVDLTKYEDLARSIAALSFALSRELESTPMLKAGIWLAHLRAQSYLYGKYVDLYDFCESLCEIGGEVGALCKDINRTIKVIVLEQGQSGKRFEFSNGLGIYLPWKKVVPKYMELRFARDTRWHEFLNKDYEGRGRGSMVIGVAPEESMMVRGGGETKPSVVMLAIPG